MIKIQKQIIFCCKKYKRLDDISIRIKTHHVAIGSAADIGDIGGRGSFKNEVIQAVNEINQNSN